MLYSKNIRVQLTAEEKKTLCAAARICENLQEAFGEMLLDVYDIDIAGIYDNLLRISHQGYFECDEQEE